jgi:ligand-binding sensor domain-containing protein
MSGRISHSLPGIIFHVAFLATCLLPSSAGHAQTNAWQRASGSFTEGNVSHLAINTAGDLFAGTNWGIYRSTDDGMNWVRLTDGIVFALGMAPNGDVYHYSCAASLCGFQRSTDNGNSWTSLSPPGLGDTVINAIAIRTNGNVFAGSGHNVLRSVDNGVTWTHSAVADSEESVTAFGLASGLLFAGITDIALPVAYGTIRRSTDNGDTWSAFSPQWANEKINGIVRNSAGYTFAATGSGVRRSTDFGATWSLNNGFNGPVSAIAINAIGYLFAAAGDRLNPGSIGGGMFRSTDRGETWVHLSAGVTLTNTLSVTVSPAGTVYAGTNYTGVFRTADTAMTWTNVNPSLYSGQIKNIAVLHDGSLFAATIDGMFLTSDNGTHWWPCNGILQAPAVNVVHENDGNVLFAGLDGIGMARSTDEGNSWSMVNAGISTQRVFSIVSKPGNILIAGTQSGLFRSTNNGDGWSAAGTGPANFVRSLIALPSGEILAGSGTGVHISTDNGTSWAPRTTGLTTTNVGSLTRDANGVLYAGTNGSVFRSTNLGAGWSSASIGLPNSFINALAFGGDGSLFASTIDSGVYVSSNNGVSWTSRNSGLPPFDTFFGTTCIASGRDGYLFVGSSRAFEGIEGGIFRTSQPLTSVATGDRQEVNAFSLEQNYPNPFNPTTSIHFSISGKGTTTLRVYDLLGREVQTLLNDELPAGLHQVTFDGSGLASGVYFYRVQSGGHAETRRFVLLR